MSSDSARIISLAFNARAASEGWPALCDADLAFLWPDLARCCALWREKVGNRAAPARSDFSLRNLKQLLQDVAIYERVNVTEGRRYRVRLMGSTFAETMGDLTGKFIDEAVPTAFVPRWYAALDATLDAMAPLRFISRSDTFGKTFLVGEYFEAPLLNDAGEANLVLAASHFDAGPTWQETSSAERTRSAQPAQEIHRRGKSALG